MIAENKNITNFKYFVSNEQYPVTKEIWESSLPLGPVNNKKNDLNVSYGKYFTEVSSFLEKHCLDILSCHAKDINEDLDISIFLEKHGELYHPSRVTVDNKNFFAINAAISHAGKSIVKQEFNILKMLGKKNDFSYIPDVYCFQDRDIPMFLARWFNGFHEFHISKDKTDNINKIKVWDTEKGDFFIEESVARQIYRKAAMILTLYYEIETFEHISLWHHAAGDFVFRLSLDNSVDLRLVTVRKYQPFIKNDLRKDDASFIIDSLLLFLVNISIKNRMDRIDGTKDFVWAAPIAVYGTIEGFFDGIGLKIEKRLLPENFIKMFKRYITSYSKNQIQDITSAVGSRIACTDKERDIIRQNIEKHADTLYYALKET